MVSLILQFRDLHKALHTRGVINWPANVGQNGKRTYLDMCQQFFESLSPEEQIEELQQMERRYKKKFQLTW